MKSAHLEELSIGVIQPDPVWEDKEENLKVMTRYIQVIKEKHPVVDLIILPEMFTSGFTMDPGPIAESMEGPTLAWMKEISAGMDVAICGSIIVTENNKYYNRLVFVQPGGELDYYDKRHLFASAGEDKNFTPGSNKVNLHFKGWAITPFICYDLRFPVWCRNTDKSDLLIYVANWPEIRIAHWKTLLPARAVENQCYVIGVNRVGTDNNNFNYNGQSCAYGPMGNCMGIMGDQEGYTLFHLQKNVLDEYRENLPFWKDGDEFAII